MYKNFDNILNSISLEELQNPIFSESREKNIAAFARFIANGHVGWDSFEDDVKNKFYTEIENLYNKEPAADENVLEEMEVLLLRCVPDNHAFVLDAQKNKLLNDADAQKIADKAIDKYPQAQVGQNSAYTLNKDSACQTLCCQGGEKNPLSIVEKLNEEGKKIGVISLSKCPQPSDPDYNIDEFCRIFADNYQKWDAVVLDVRGNEGGNDKLLSFMTEKLYGTAPRYHRTQEMRMTPEAKILQGQKIKSAKFLDQLHEMYPNGYKSSPQNEPDFDEKNGYPNNIYILTDRKTSSSAEFVCGLHKHPKVKYIGENTCGCGEYGDTAQLRLPNGGFLNMGMYKNELFSGIKEGVGLEPTHRTAVGKDAFEHCLNIMEKDFYIEKLKTRVAGSQVKESEKIQKVSSQNSLSANYAKTKGVEY